VRSKNGQVLIIILLAMVIAVTVALSVASRAVTNVRLTTHTEEAQVAYSAAEAGIEQVLKTGPEAAMSNPPSGTLSQANYQTTITAVGGSSTSDTFETLNTVGKDDSIQLVVDKDTTVFCANTTDCLQSVDVYWQSPSAGSTSPTLGALEISQIYAYDVHESSPGSGSFTANGTQSDLSDDYYVMKRYVVNFDCIAPGAYNFDPTTTTNSEISCTSGSFNPTTLGTSYNTKATVKIVNPYGSVTCPSPPSQGCEPRLLRIKPLGNSTKVAVKTSSNFSLPLQGYKIDSTGVYKDSTKKISVYKSYNSLPSFFDYVVYSGTGNLSKN